MPLSLRSRHCLHSHLHHQLHPPASSAEPKAAARCTSRAARMSSRSASSATAQPPRRTPAARCAWRAEASSWIRRRTCTITSREARATRSTLCPQALHSSTTCPLRSDTTSAPNSKLALSSCVGEGGDALSACTYPDFPTECLPGLAGDSEEPNKQYSLACNGLCPPGKLCAGATAVPADCNAGGYCPAGSFQAQFCPPGTSSNRTDLDKEEDCTECQPGASCAIGSTKETPCTPGTYNDQPGAAACIACPATTYMPSSGATACDVCGPGYYCVRSMQAPTPDLLAQRDQASDSRAPLCTNGAA